jgi:hypothetical protein
MCPSLDLDGLYFQRFEKKEDRKTRKYGRSVTCSTDPAPDPSIIKKNRKINLDFYRFVTSL